MQHYELQNHYTERNQTQKTIHVVLFHLYEFPEVANL